MPIITMLETNRSPSVGKPGPVARSAPRKSPSRSRATMTWPTISPGVRLRTRRCVPVWQNEQLSVQPTWLDRQSVPRSVSGM